MKTVRLTAKRQATLPRELCEELHVGPGDTLLVERRTVEGESLWTLRPASALDTSWFGGAKEYAKGKSHDLAAIRKSIAKGRTDDSR